MSESRITRPSKTSSPKKGKRLNEKELGTLYAYCKTPLRLHHMLEKNFPKRDALMNETSFDATPLLAEIHDSLSEQGPDDALLSLALMGWILEDYCSDYYADIENLRILCTELKCEAENVIHDLGRLRIDLDSYKAEISQTEIYDHLSNVPDSLCILASIYQEMIDVFKEVERRDLAQMVRILCYQAEAQADHAWGYIDAMMKPGAKEQQNPVLQDIPMPYDMQPDIDTDKIIDLSLFRRQ